MCVCAIKVKEKTDTGGGLGQVIRKEFQKIKLKAKSNY